MYRCPACSQGLMPIRGRREKFWHCPGCGGRMANLALLRRHIDPKRVSELWRHGLREGEEGPRTCPVCHGPMRNVTVSDAAFPLDLCTRCQLIWFDPLEFERLAETTERRQAEDASQAGGERRSPEVTEGERTGPSFRGRAATTATMGEPSLAAVGDRAREAQRRRFGVGGPAEEWKRLPACFSLPVEFERDTFPSPPWVTRLLALLLLGTGIAGLFDLSALASRFALHATEPGRMGGGTFLTALFLHANGVHLLANVYFLAVFGDNVEAEGGRLRFLLLFLLCALADGIAFVLTAPDPALHVGASGGVTGIVVLYTMQFPHARLAWLVPTTRRFDRIGHWVPFPVWGALLFWVAIAFVADLLSPSGIDPVSWWGIAAAGAIGAALGLARRHGGLRSMRLVRP